ncbi:type II toxin-antitoxin system RelB/DinJ family antitoxin [Bartonella machadoae]|uniref:type II toxin-antitoxin system RelB/DinJ family antitoxin n=1 Tax=Bartonella machadoae TaxID=2893471 RepID=UPI001F4CF3E0|nr:type II toxin-antitoxin system RelB/DinJ family antitoxin [Bartonella machadoae]UNE55088.1 type II toxin-antitoxin system RelB/DinJ family antitoxin [Bartonella machadoae]
MKADSVVRARIPTEMKKQAMITLERMGLSASDLIRMTFLRVAEEGCLPFDVKVPNNITRKAIKELDEGKGKTFENAEALFKDLGI